jgi:hypothetical protein
MYVARGVPYVGWFDFEHKSHKNREIKMYVIRFGLIDF